MSILNNTSTKQPRRLLFIWGVSEIILAMGLLIFWRAETGILYVVRGVIFSILMLFGLKCLKEGFFARESWILEKMGLKSESAAALRTEEDIAFEKDIRALTSEKASISRPDMGVSEPGTIVATKPAPLDKEKFQRLTIAALREAKEIIADGVTKNTMPTYQKENGTPLLSKELLEMQHNEVVKDPDGWGLAYTVAGLEEEPMLDKVGPYLSEKDLEVRRIVFVHCEDERCGFLVEFKYPNCTFYFCKEHKTGINLDLTTISDAGVECELHGKMERYDLLEEDNVCPRCEKTTMAILSVGK